MAELTHKITLDGLEYRITSGAHEAVKETLAPFRETARKSPETVELEGFRARQGSAKPVEHKKKGR